MPYETVYGTVLSGEIAGATSATQLPNVSCRRVRFKAVGSNTGSVYLGGAGVTKIGGDTDATTGWELAAGEETDWIPIDNLSKLYLIADAATDDLVYFALR